MDNLRLKSSNRIRTFLFEKIYQFRKPLANYHIPQNTMLRFRFFYEFLLANERPTAQEIKDEYLDTVSKVYYSYFRSYLQRLMKLKFSETATKLDMLGDGCKSISSCSSRFTLKSSLTSGGIYGSYSVDG